MAEISLKTPSVKTETSRTRFLVAQIFQKGGIYFILIAWAFIAIVPFVWMLSTSVMTLGEAQGVRFFPSEIHLENYVEAWRIAEFAEYFFNSVQITTITLVGQLIVSILAAYAFARIQFPGRDLFFGILVNDV